MRSSTEPDTDTDTDTDTEPGADTEPGTAARTEPGTEPAKAAHVATGPAEDADAAAGSPAGTRTEKGRRRSRGLLVPIAVLVLCLAAAGLFLAAQQERSGGAAANRAMTDSAANDQVTGEISSALARIFSYGPGSTAATERSARVVLEGKAADQYEELFGQVRSRVDGQRITLTTQVVRAGVVRLEGDAAELLVYLDQSSNRAGKSAAHVAAQLSVTAQHKEGQWRITDMKAR